MLLYQIAIEKGGKPYDQILADPAGLSDFAENSGMLVEMAGTEVCADPANMIREALDLIADGKRKTKPDHDPIREILPNTDAFLDFADAMADMMFWAMVFALRAQELVRALSMQLERVRMRLPGAEKWIAQTVAKLSDCRSWARSILRRCRY